MKLHGKILGVSEKCFYTVVLACTIGILLGSFFDFQINERLTNVTKLGSFFAADLLFHYKAGESSPWLSVLNWLIIAALYVWPMLLCNRILDEKDADKLIAVGAAILIAGVVSDNVNQWLKQLASRPRYKYLITLDDPGSEFRSWWQMIPNLAGSNDSFKSWPSGNMTIAAMMFSLPMLADVTKKRSEGKNFRCFIVACAFVLIYGYNRIHMTNHFLTDVCFGTLITYLIHAVVSKALLPADKLD